MHYINSLELARCPIIDTAKTGRDNYTSRVDEEMNRGKHYFRTIKQLKNVVKSYHKIIAGNTKKYIVV